MTHRIIKTAKPTPFSAIIILFICSIFLSQIDVAHAQTFASTKNGDWQDPSTWSVPSSCNPNPSTGFPPISKDWGCGVKATILHEVTFNGNANNFGNGAFNEVEIKNGGNLTFTGNITVEGGGSIPVFKMENGAYLQINGTLTLNRGVNIVIPSGAKMVVKDLVIGDNRPTITVQDGGELVVLNSTQLRDRSTLNVDGKFVTKELQFTSGGTINGNGGNSSIEVLGDLGVTNGKFNLSNGANLKVQGKTDVGQSGEINLTHTSSVNFGDDVRIPNGASVKMSNNSTVLIQGDLELDGGGLFEMRNNTESVITGNVTFSNGKINTSNFAEIFVGGFLSASNGAEVNMGNNSSVNICDYQNSTQADSHHIRTSQNTYFGQGCFTLPVAWEKFESSVDKQQNIIQLTWTTTSERENSHFIIERSPSGVDKFEEVGEKLAAGWSSETLYYSFNESLNQVAKYGGSQVFYRIKQVDFNGQSQYSPVIRVSIPKEKTAKNQWTVYPNPTNGTQLHLERLSKGETNNVTFSARIINIPNSEKLTSSDLSVLELHLKEEMKKAPKGICVIELVSGEEISHIKVLKN
ncbi:fibronectin type III domain-containing protein [Pleomorphovibrio marinus]|uniref:hypothetical protein n=1 Tax=Pleomorphovibrio marinus TaxID=2164132 RepID=UPI000E0A49D7|nr:hypothetical protein [Pleomorphovibrio marinus]